MRRMLVFGLAAVCAGAARGQEFWLPATLDSLRAAATADSNDPVRHHAVALAHLNRRKLDEAERAFRVALACDPRYAPALFGLAVIGVERHPELLRPPGKRPPGAALLQLRDSVFDHYRMAFLLDPLVTLELPDAPADTASGGWISHNVALATRGAVVALLRGASGRAFALADWVIGQYETFQVGGRIPDDVLWVHSVAGARLGRFEPGIRGLSLLVSRAEGEERADTTGLPRFLVTNDLRYMLAYFRGRAGHTWSAVSTYREVLAMDLGYWMAHVRLADLFESMGRRDDALSERQQAVVLKDDPMLAVDLGITLARVGQGTAADSVLALAQAALPRVALIRYRRAELAWMRNDPAAASEAYEAFLALAPARLVEELADARMRLEVLRRH